MESLNKLDRRALDRFTSNYVVRKAEPFDLRLCAIMAYSAHFEHDPDYRHTSDEYEQVVDRIAAGWRRGEYTTLVCLTPEGQYVGMVHFAVVPPDLFEKPRVHLFGLYVLPEQRKPGAAFSLIRAVREEARKRKIDTIEYSVDLTREPDRRMYRTLGGEPAFLVYRTTFDLKEQ